MSEAPTHAAGVPTPARPQQTPQQQERTPQQAQRADVQHTEAQRVDAQRADAQRVDAQRTEAQRTDTQRTDAQRADNQRTDAQRTEHQRTEPQRTEQRHAEPQRHAESRPIGKLEDEWQAVQYDFVDDPKAAVRKADDLVARALEELTSRHRSLTKQLEGNSDPQTEDLRLALHRYRELFKSLVAVK
ncbi:hypothetical protein [Lentzea sp. NBRC 102530]|uniref:hypothetical protein n=1 Tax=Lentzea sp. NBRC 102530 TaxID=3032201 RepID=UPI0024A17202|nr:hypothetical protein [Lentzea sp. NBRC 102530]GLY55108.1 hypothetical protein Lesp01_87630 [Lentzea sp. NBRC 102530]